MRRVLVKADEAAFYADVSMSTVNRWVRDGHLSAVACALTKGRAHLYDITDVERVAYPTRAT